MTITIHNVNMPSVFKRKDNVGIVDTAIIEFGKGVENFLANIILLFDDNNFTMQNVFVNKTEYVRISYCGSVFSLSKDDFSHISVE